MRLLAPHQGTGGKSGTQGFSLTEFLVASSLFLLVVGGVLSSHLFGLRLLTALEVQADYTDKTRILLSQLTREMQTAKSWRVGQGSASLFNPLNDGNAQVGVALQIYPTNQTTNYIRYYKDSTDRKLKRISNQELVPRVVVEPLANNDVFTAQDYGGIRHSNAHNGAVLSLHFLLESKIQSTMVGGQNLSGNRHEFTAKIATRAPD